VVLRERERERERESNDIRQKCHTLKYYTLGLHQTYRLGTQQKIVGTPQKKHPSVWIRRTSEPPIISSIQFFISLRQQAHQICTLLQLYSYKYQWFIKYFLFMKQKRYRQLCSNPATMNCEFLNVRIISIFFSKSIFKNSNYHNFS
jgi:hypothetical protein